MNRQERRALMRAEKAKEQVLNLQSGGGYGQGLPSAIPARGEAPQVNPFIIPKDSGLNVVTKLFPSNYYVEWTPTMWRQACDQATKMGWPIQYAALTTWCYQSSPFIQHLFREIGIGIDNIRFILQDPKGNEMTEWTDEICNKAWFNDLKREMVFAWFWGFSGLNYNILTDPKNGTYPGVYRYPMQNIDPINRMLRQSSFNFADGIYFSDFANTLFVQPSSNEESFLGWMQPISRAYIYINSNLNNWENAGKKMAYPILMAGYPQNSESLDVDGNAYNPFKAQAEAILENVEPGKGVAYPYTKDAAGNIQKTIEIEMTTGSQGTAGAHRIYNDFNESQKNDILQMILLSTLTSNVGARGSLALGEIHMDKYQSVVKSLGEWLTNELNKEFNYKLSQLYRNFPKEATFGINKAKIWSIPEIKEVTDILNKNGMKLTPDFITNMGLKPEDIEISSPVQKEVEPTKINEVEVKKKINKLHSHVHLASRPNPIKNIGSIQDREIQFAYENQGEIIFPEMYEAYNDAFLNAIIPGMKINAAFESLTNTAFWEQYMVNTFQFSSAKNIYEMKLLQGLMYDENRKKRGYSEFKTIAKEQLTIINDTWFNTEYELATRGAVMVDAWSDLWENRDIFPMARYETKGDERVCDICAPLNGKIFRIDDPQAQEFYVPNHFNCSCEWVPTDEGSPMNKAEMDKRIKTIPEQFRGNVGTDGIFPRKDSVYFDAIKSANDVNSTMFSAKPENYYTLNNTEYTEYAKRIAVNTWLKESPTKNGQNIMFRNRKWLLNITMNQESFKKISKGKGFENIKETIEKPSEIWGRWKNVDEQKTVILNFIRFDGKNAYIVESIGGIITDAYYRQHTDSKNLRRQGVLFAR